VGIGRGFRRGDAPSRVGCTKVGKRKSRKEKKRACKAATFCKWAKKKCVPRPGAKDYCSYVAKKKKNAKRACKRKPAHCRWKRKSKRCVNR